MPRRRTDGDDNDNGDNDDDKTTYIEKSQTLRQLAAAFYKILNFF